MLQSGLADLMILSGSDVPYSQGVSQVGDVLAQQLFGVVMPKGINEAVVRELDAAIDYVGHAACACQSNHGIPGRNQFNPDYGSFCKIWDILEPYCEEFGENHGDLFCVQPFCWVDPATCPDAKPSAYFEHEEKKLHYSYEAACGAVDHFTDRANCLMDQVSYIFSLLLGVLSDACPHFSFHFV